MFAYETSSYEKVEKPKQDKKIKQNGYEEIRKLVEDGDDTKLKETINKEGQEQHIKFKFNLFD